MGGRPQTTPRSFVNDLLLRNLLLDRTGVEVLDISPCIADDTRIKFIAKINRSLSDVLPVLFLSTPNSKLTRSPMILSFTVEQHNVMIGHDGNLAVTYVKDEAEKNHIIDRVIDLINRGIKYNLSHRRDLEGMIDEKRRLTPMSLYELFPKTNCGDCSEEGCFNYVAKVLLGETGYDRCPHVDGAAIRSAVTPVDLGWRIEFA